MRRLLSLCLLSASAGIGLLIAAGADALTVSVDCAVAVAHPPAAGNQSSGPCTLATPAGTITQLELSYKYAITTDLDGGTASFTHSMLDPALSSFDQVSPIIQNDSNLSSVFIVTIFAPTAAQLSALATNGAIDLAWTAADVLTLSGAFRWTITFEPVPEPSASALLGAGLAGMALVARRRAAA